MASSGQPFASIAEGAVTIEDVAALAGVNPATVSRALRGVPGKVAPATRARIEALAREVGYRPNTVAASLRTRRTHLIGVVVPDLANPLFGPIVQGLEAELRRRGYLCLVAQTPAEPDARRAMIAALADRQVAGLVVTSAENADPMLDAIRDLRVPVVLVNRGRDEARFASVVNDDFESVRLVLEHLLALGHRRIAHVAGPERSSTGSARRRAFERLAREHRIASVRVVAADAFTRPAGHAAAKRLLSRGVRPSAVFAGNDLIAVGVLDALREAGLRVPDDVSVVGHNDMPLADAVAPPLTTVHVAVEAMSRWAAESILERIEAPERLPTIRVLTPTLVVRESTGHAKG